MAEHDNVLQHDVSLSIPKRELLNTVYIYVQNMYVYSIWPFKLKKGILECKLFLAIIWSVVDNYQPAKKTHGTHT